MSPFPVMASSSSPPPPISGWKYDVFLSFRGVENRKSFVDHLYNSLIQREIKVFKDESDLQRGKPIAGILKEIEVSRSSIVILSDGYTDSEWCLNELQKTLECKKDRDHIVFPVFYKVTPDKVQQQTGKAINKRVKRYSESDEKVVQWRKALKDVTEFAGWVLGERYENEFIHQITEGVYDSLCSTSPSELAKKIKSSVLEHKRSAVGSIRHLGANDCVTIANAGAIPELVNLLKTNYNVCAQEDAIAALLKLSKQINIKQMIMAEPLAIPGIVHVLKYGQNQAREYAAGTILNLSLEDGNRDIIGSFGAIPALSTLLKEGTQRGKENSAAALSKLCICINNREKALKDGLVAKIIPEMTTKFKGETLLEDVIGILGSLALNDEGEKAIERVNDAVQELVKVIVNESITTIRARGNAVGILWHLYSKNKSPLTNDDELKLMETLDRLSKNENNNETKRKAELLLGKIKQKKR